MNRHAIRWVATWLCAGALLGCGDESSAGDDPATPVVPVAGSSGASPVVTAGAPAVPTAGAASAPTTSAGAPAPAADPTSNPTADPTTAVTPAGAADACVPAPEGPQTSLDPNRGPEQLCGRPAYGGEAGDEALITMVDAEQRMVPTADGAPAILVPSEGQVFKASDPPPTFSWSEELALGAGCGAPPTPSVWERLGDLLVGTARAHCPPRTGDIYFLKVSIPGDPCTHSVLTTEESWQVDEAMWAAMAGSGGQPITLDLMSAYLTDNRVSEGPFLPELSTTFVVMP